MQAMLLAAGLGTRLQPYTHCLPKPLFPVLNRPLLYILIDILHQAGCARIVVNGHHLSNLVQDAVGRMPDVRFQDEPTILGTGGSIREALEAFSDAPILVMNGDIFHTIDVGKVYRYHLDSGNRVTMALHDYPRFNTVTIDSERIVTFNPAVESAKKNRMAFTGIHVVDPDVIRMIPPGRFHHIIDLYQSLAQKGEQVGYIRVDGSYWKDIGTPEDYLQLHEDLLTGGRATPFALSAGNSKWLIDRQSSIADDVLFEGWGCVGRAVIGRGANLRNCVVWDNAVVQDGESLENKIITPQSCDKRKL